MQRLLHLLLLVTAFTISFSAPAAAQSAAEKSSSPDRSWIVAPEKEEARPPWFGAILAGGMLFGAAYLPSAIVGVRSINAGIWGGVIGGRKANDLGALVLPLFGAFKYAASPGADYGWDVYSPRQKAEWGRLAMLSGLAQTTGLALVVIGLVVDNPVPPRLRAFAPSAVEPTFGSDRGGVQLRWAL